MFITFKLNANGTLSNKEHLNNINEVNEWTDQAYYTWGFATIVVLHVEKNVACIATDNGENYETIKKDYFDNLFPNVVLK